MRLKILQIFCLVLTALSWTAPGGLFALPQGENVESGSAIFERPDPSTTNNIPTLNIVAGDRAVINFNSFNIGQNEAVYFIQPSASASVLSRVTGSSASEIAGILSANGVLFFVNRNGVRFTPSAQVNVNSLIASTLDVSTNNFINGNYIFEHSLGGVYAQILNEGRITGNNIALVASGAHNAGIIAAKTGIAHLVSGDKVTVSFDQKGLIQVEINEQTSAQVFDLQGNSVKDAVANSGTIEAKEVVMSARTAAGIFENAINQTGIVKATGMSQQGGVIRIRANRNIQVSGALEAPAGGSSVSSAESIAIKADLKTIGNTNIMADKDIDVRANIVTLEGDLSLIADADLDGLGSFLQASKTFISTINYGDIAIQSSGEATLANIISAGDLILKQGGAPTIFTQHPGCSISTVGSLSIGRGVTINAANTLYSIGKDLINLGTFFPQNSRVELVSKKTALISGSITFNDFKVIEPGKKVFVSAGDMITTLGVLTLNGSYGNLLTITSTEPGTQWKILPLGETDIAYTQISDCYNARGPPLKFIHSSSSGNNFNLDLDPYWTGQGISSNWSDPDNWDSGTVPTAFDIVTFDGVTGLNPNKDSYIDPAFPGTIDNFIVDGYTGTITLGRDLSVSGNWVRKSGTFDAGNSTVSFIDASKPSHISGNTAFYDLTCLTPGKKLVFEAGSLTTVQNTFTIEGSDASHIILTSSIEAKGSMFGIYIAKLSDKEGNPYLEYLDVYYSVAYGPQIPILAKHYYIPAELNIDWDDTHTWSGTASNLWNTGGVGGNWSGAVVPVAGDDLVFPDNLASGRYSTSNDIVAATSFNSITIQGTGYTLAGNSVTLAAGGLTDSYVGGSNTISLNIVLSGTRTITVTDAGENLTISGVISGNTFGITKAGNGTLTLNGANTYTGAVTISAGTLSVNTVANQNANSSLGTGANTPAISIAAAGILKYIGTGHSTNRNIAPSASGATIDASGSGTLTLTGGIGTGAIRNIVLTGTGVGNFTTAAINTSTGTLTKNGIGTWTLSFANAYTGLTTINAGTLRYGVINALSSGGVTVNNGGTYDWNSFADTIGALTVADGGLATCTGAGAQLRVTSLAINSGANGGGHVTTGSGTLRLDGNVTSTGGATNALITGNVLLSATRTFTITNAADGLTVSAVISGNTFGITKAGNGTLTLDGANTYTGAVTISAGTLSVNTVANQNANSSLGTGANTPAIAMAAAGTFKYTGIGHSTNRNIAPSASGATIDASGSGTLTLTGGIGTGANRNIVLTGTGVGDITTAIINTGTGTLTKNGIGTWNISVANSTFSGAITINAGTLKAGIAAAIPTVAMTVNNTGIYDWNSFADTIGALTVADGGLATCTGAGAILTISTLSIRSGANGGGNITTGAGTLTLGGNVTSTGGSTNALITGNLALGAATRTFTLTNAADGLTVSATISGNAVGITKAGNGTLTLDGANTYTGAVTITAGTLSVNSVANTNNNSPLGTGANTPAIAMAAAGTFKYTGTGHSTNRNIAPSASGATIDASGSGTLTLTGGIGTGANRNIVLTGTGDGSITTTAIATGTGTLTKNGTGTWTLSFANTYTGATTINDGILSASILANGGVASSVGQSTNAAANLVLGGGTLQYTGATVTTNRNFTLTAATSSTIEVFAAAAILTISGASVNTTGALIKTGDGALTLSGANTHSGGVTLNAGTLNINNNTALGSGTFTINAGTIDNTSGALKTLTNNNAQIWNVDVIFTGSSSLTMGTGIVTIGADRVITVSANTLGIGALSAAGYSLTKEGGGTLALAGTATIKDLTIAAGTLDAGNSAINVSGNWLNLGTFAAGTGTVTFNGGSSTITTGGDGATKEFYKVVVNAPGATKTISGAMMINNVLQVDAGFLAGDSDVTVKGGSVTGDGTINMIDGTFTVRGTGNFGNSTSGWTFYNLTFGESGTSAATTKTGTNTITVTATLTVALNHTLWAGNDTTWNLEWASYLKNIIMIASGYDHTIALTDDGYVFAWGCNFYGQLGDGTTDDASIPVQVLGEGGTGNLSGITEIAAGGYHSVALGAGGAVYAWGYNNNGQLGDGTQDNRLTPIQVLGEGGSGDLLGVSGIAAGGFVTAAVKDGNVYCWGYNADGELGNGTTTPSPLPVRVHGGAQAGTYLENITQVSVGGFFVLALAADDSVYSWGFNEDGELGDGTQIMRSEPVHVVGELGSGTLSNIAKVSAGETHSLALTNDGYVYSWGYNCDSEENVSGQLGDGSAAAFSLVPVQVQGGEQGIPRLHDVTDISAGAAHSLAIADGFVFSWGSNHYGQLGNDSTVDSSTPVYVHSGTQSATEPNLYDISGIAAGGAQTVALYDIRVFNCGNNENGQLGNGTTVDAVEQIRVQAGSTGPVIQLVVEGTLEPQTSTVNFSNLFQPNLDIPDLTYNNLMFSDSGGSFLLTGTTTVLGNLIIDNATLSAGSNTLNVSGNWTNTNGTFNAGSGTVNLNSSTQTQSVTSGNSAFNILTITNSYSGGVAFEDRLVTAYLNAGSGVKKLSFSAASESQPHTITASFNVSGAFGNLIELAPLVAGTWYLNAPVSSLQYLKIGSSHQADGKTITAANSQDLTGNVNWNITP